MKMTLASAEQRMVNGAVLLASFAILVNNPVVLNFLRYPPGSRSPGLALLAHGSAQERVIVAVALSAFSLTGGIIHG